MDYKTASEVFGIPVAAFRRMKKQGLIDGDKVIKPNEKPYFMFLCKIWGDNGYLRMQLARKKIKVRLSLIERPELTRIERHILTRFLNHYKQSNTEWLYAKVVEKEVSSLFSVPLNQGLKNTVKRMRQRAKDEVKKIAKTITNKPV